MSLIATISSTLKTWVFKKKASGGSASSLPAGALEACYYCPEMCRFACPVAETLRDNTVTPRGKMSLLAPRGERASRRSG